MVLYDKNYNFLGLTNQMLNFLGYEEFTEFKAMHSDFANLFVNKEGYIYKFNNFSWIDFVLYSGTAKKSALLKQKNGNEVEVGVTVKEIFLSKDIDGMDKLFQVKIISENFLQSSNTSQNSTPSEVNSLGLNIPINDTTKNDTTDASQTSPLVTTSNGDFKLNFNVPSDEVQPKTEMPIEKEITNEHKKVVPDLKLDFLKQNEAQENKIEQNHIPEIKKDENKESDLKLDFLKNEDKKDELPPIIPDFLQTQNDTDTQEENKDKDNGMKLDFLKPKDKDEVQPETKQTTSQSDMKLDFLKQNPDDNQQGSNEKETPKNENELLAKDFLKPKEINDDEPKLNFLKEEKTDEQSPLDFLKPKENTEEESPLEFLKPESKDSTMPDTKQENLSDDMKLDFLKPKKSIEELINKNKPSDTNIDKAEDSTTDIFTQPSQRANDTLSEEKLDFLKPKEKEIKHSDQKQPTNAKNEITKELQIPEIPKQEEVDLQSEEKFLKHDFDDEIKKDKEKNEDIQKNRKEQKSEKSSFLNFLKKGKNLKEQSAPKNEFKLINPFEKEEKVELNKEDNEPSFTLQNDEEKELLKTDKSGKNKNEIIEQIKQDIKEIDNTNDNDIKEFDTKSSASFIPTFDLGVNDSNQSEKKSFTSTLNNLFRSEKTDQNEEKFKTELNNLNNDPKKAVQNQYKDDESHELKKSDTHPQQSETHKLNTNIKPTLSSLGLEASDENDLLIDFINESKSNIDLMKDILNIEDYSKIIYTLVKIKSSAELLNLDDIIECTNVIKEESQQKNRSKIEYYITILEQQIHSLEMYIEKSTV